MGLSTDMSKLNTVCVSFEVWPEFHIPNGQQALMFKLCLGPQTLVKMTQMPLNRVKVDVHGSEEPIIKKAHFNPG
jgi:anthranilate/para-aminobenzoate synthase component II